jgi:hypothetical protein
MEIKIKHMKVKAPGWLIILIVITVWNLLKSIS